MIEIRELTLEDIARNEKELTWYMSMSLADNIEDIDVETLSKKYYQDMLTFTKDGSAILIGAFDGEKLVGFHWGYEFSRLGRRRIHSYFNGIDPAYRGQKIGNRFFDRLTEIARERGVHEIEAMATAKNELVVNYHLRNGFEIDRYQMVKRL